MAPLPSNSTGVFYLDYNTCDEDHTIQMRFGTGSSPIEAANVMDGFLTALSPDLQLVTILGARVRDLGANVTYPVTWDGDNTYGSGAGNHVQSAWYIDFVGRSIDGRRCRISMFGAKGAYDGGSDDYRLTAAESTSVAAALAALEALPFVPVSISGEVVNWQQYANLGQNAYWRNHIR